MSTYSNVMYADEINRRYPIHTKEATVDSYESAVDTGDIKLPAIAEKFTKAASFYGIQLADKLDKVASTASEPTIPVASFNIGDGTLTFGQVSDLADLTKAASTIIELRDSHSRGQLKEAALSVLATASDMDADLSSDIFSKIARIAGVGVGDREEIEHELEKRASLNNVSDPNNLFWTACKDIEALSDDDFYKQANLERICSTIEDIDQHFNNEHRYGHDLKAPEDVVFKSSVDDLLKEASDLTYVPAADATLSKTAIAERETAINNFFKRYFGQKGDITGNELINKVASCSKRTFEALLESLEN